MKRTHWYDSTRKGRTMCGLVFEVKCFNPRSDTAQSVSGRVIAKFETSIGTVCEHVVIWVSNSERHVTCKRCAASDLKRQLNDPGLKNNS